MKTATRSRVDLDQGFLPGRSPREPRLAKDLLRLLEVDRKSRDEQREAVKKWLQDHRPSRLLRDDLKDAELLS